MLDLTDRQKQVYDFIEQYQMKCGASPTLAEIKSSLQVSSDNGVLKHLKVLEHKGLIARNNTPRGISLLASVREKLFAEMVVLPLLGSVPAGNPVESFEQADDWVAVAERMVPDRKNCFLLKVRGDSMKDASILDGDIVIVQSNKEAKVGQTVVALVDRESTVKTLAKDQDGWYLHPENELYKDIRPAGELNIQGVVVGLIRKY